jgi:hypothetical protein
MWVHREQMGALLATLAPADAKIVYSETLYKSIHRGSRQDSLDEFSGFPGFQSATGNCGGTREP